MTPRRSKPLTFGDRLKQFRQRAGWSCAELAARAGLSRQAVSMIESGARGDDPTWSTVQALAAALDKTPNDFTG